jgi:hypothetical protein
MECPQCNSPLMVSDSKFESDIGTTDVYSVLTMVCINPKCELFAGKDLNNPKKVAAMAKNKVGE